VPYNLLLCSPSNLVDRQSRTQVKLRRRGSPTKYIARVIAIGRDCDIALLTVDDPQFWKDSKSFVDISQRRTLPKLEERISVVGYPVGGENLSVTSGVVSRIDMQGENRTFFVDQTCGKAETA